MLKTLLVVGSGAAGSGVPPGRTLQPRSVPASELAGYFRDVPAGQGCALDPYSWVGEDLNGTKEGQNPPASLAVSDSPFWG